jgi:hypothetical protein
VTEATYRSPDRPQRLAPYVSSGRTPILGLLAGLAAGGAVALVLSVLYAYGTIYIPIVQLEFLLTALFGAAIGATTGGVMHRFKVRSRFVIVTSALLLGTFGWAFSWVPWLLATLSRMGLEASFDPWWLAQALAAIYENGTWSIGSSSTTAVSGVMLGIVWVAEAATIVGLSTLVGVTMSADRVFCEKCESWCTVLPDRALYDFLAGAQLKRALVEEADLEALHTTPRPSAPDRWLSLKLGFCPGCGETNVIAIDDVKQTADNKGNTTRTPRAFIPYHCVSRGDMAELRRRLGS